MILQEAPLTREAFATAVGASTDEVAQLDEFRERLSRWNQVMNLVGPASLPHYWRRHALDSAQLFHVEQSVSVWADVGAGAGFPGVVLAILLKSRPGARVHLIESMAKRVRFLEEVSEALALPVQIHHARAEAVPAPPGLQMVTARACAPLSRLLGYTSHFFSAGARGLFLKGRDVGSELIEARLRWTFEAHTIESRSDPSGRLVLIEGLAPRA